MGVSKKSKKAKLSIVSASEPEILPATPTAVWHFTVQCSDCRYWETRTPNLAPGRGLCRLMPSQLLVINGNAQALYPAPMGDEACGQHQPIPPAPSK